MSAEVSTTLTHRKDTAVAEVKVARRVRRGHERSTVLTAAMIACSLYFLLPLVWLAISATKTNSDLFDSFGFWFAHTFHFFQNVRDVFTYQNDSFVRWTLNTAFYAGASALGATALATAAGYAFAKYRFPGATAIFAGILGAIMIPMTALAIPTYLLFARAGLTNTPWAVILPSLVSPFGVYLMRVYAAEAVSDSLIESARVDGASEFRILWTVSLRLLAPGIVTVFLFTLVATWNNYFLPLIMLSSSNLYPITVGLANWQAQASGEGGATPLFAIVLTASFISIIPLVAAFLYLQRYWQTGLSAGAVKG